MRSGATPDGVRAVASQDQGSILNVTLAVRLRSGGLMKVDLPGSRERVSGVQVAIALDRRFVRARG
jgi:hypothetical protein